MKVTVEDVTSVKKILNIEVPSEDISRELNRVYGDLKKTAKIKGFRPGKAPRSVLERVYKKDVQADVSAQLIKDSFAKAIEQTELNIIGRPNIDPPELIENETYQYTATVEIAPQIGDIDYKGLTLKKTLYGASDDDIDLQLEMLQKRLTRHEKIDAQRPLEQGDFALIDYEGFQDGKPLAETQKTENFTLKIGDGHIAKEFDDQMVGMQADDTREFEVSFADDHYNPKLAGQSVTFHTRLNEIRAEVLPDIDDEFAKQLGPFETLEDLKAAIRKNLDEGYAKRQEHELNEQVFKALIEKTDFELPESMVEYELNGIVAEVERSFSQENRSLEDEGLSRESLSEKYLPTAEKQVRRHLILSRLIEQEDIPLSAEELQQGYAGMAQEINQPVEKIAQYYASNKEQEELFKHTLLEKKGIALIIENSQIEEVEPVVADKNDPAGEQPAAEGDSE